jgi:HSP20 family protein
MANVVRWDPYREMDSMSRLMDRWFGGIPRVWVDEADGAEGYVPLDLYETDNEVVVQAALPGVKPEDVDIQISGDTLTIRGESKHEEEEKKRDYYRQESWYGSFARSVTLPVQVNADGADAVFENGVLKLTIPKAEEAKPKTIKVKPREMIEAKK